MNIPEDPNSSKSIKNQSPTSKITDSVSTPFEKLRVSHPPRGKFVRLSHRFIQCWTRVLSPLEFTVFCVLSMWADFTEFRETTRTDVGNWPLEPLTSKEPNPAYNHTNGYHGIGELVSMTGISRTTVKRALSQLVEYGLLKHAEPDARKRTSAGVECDWIVDQDVEPPSEVISLTRKALRELQANCRQADKTSSEVSPPGPPAAHPLGHQRPTPLGHQRPTPWATSGPPKELEILDSGVETPTSSSSLEAERENTTTTTPAPPPPHEPPKSNPEVPAPAKPEAIPMDPELTNLRQVGTMVLDHNLLIQLWQECRHTQPDITVKELQACMSSKSLLAIRPGVGNGPAYLVRCVVQAIAGGWLATHRKQLADDAVAFRHLHQRFEAEHAAWDAYDAGEGPSPMTGRTRAENEARNRQIEHGANGGTKTDPRRLEQ